MKNILCFEGEWKFNTHKKPERFDLNSEPILRMLKEYHKCNAIYRHILKNFYDESKKSLVRNLEDKTLDISILGTVIPFELFSPKDKKILNTVERINMTLRTYTGGYKRFETDTYREGKPWIIATRYITPTKILT